MGEISKIQWTKATWNPWHGCKKVSAGCKFCYMYRDKERYGQEPTKVLRSKTKFREPFKWKDPTLVFTCSWSDWFIEEADKWRMNAWEVIRDTPHTYQILTKRPDRIADNLPPWFELIADRVWIGVSVENQSNACRINYLDNLPCIKYVSFEPLIGPIQWDDNWNMLDWIIVGGESGNDTGPYRYRPMELSWAQHLVDKAKENDIACFFKQMGTYQAKLRYMRSRTGDNFDELPLSLQVREFPITNKNQMNGSELAA